MVDGFVNEGIRLMAMATGHNVATVTINQRDEVLSYKLPADHIRTLGVTWGSDKRPLEGVTWSDMDQFTYLARAENVTLRNRWLRTVGIRSGCGQPTPPAVSSLRQPPARSWMNNSPVTLPPLCSRWLMRPASMVCG